MSDTDGLRPQLPSQGTLPEESLALEVVLASSDKYKRRRNHGPAEVPWPQYAFARTKTMVEF
jgi:hypothetical protein